MTNIFADVRLSLRLLAKNPGTTAVIILALALGIGVNVSTFSSVNAMVLHPFPYPQLDRIVTLWETVPKLADEQDPVTPAAYLNWLAQSRSYEHLAAYRPANVNMTGIGDPERVSAAAVSASYFPLLGMAPAQGRTFREDECEPGKANVVVVSDGFWKRRLASEPFTGSRVIAIDGQQYTIVGVMPSDFNFPLETEIWMPLTFTPADKQDRANHTLFVVGKLRRGVDVQQARTELSTIADRFAQQHPDTNEGRKTALLKFAELRDQVTQHFVWTLVATAAFVLLLACANVANLHLARAIGREREIAIRLALGAGRIDVFRQLLVESLMLASFSAVVGLVLANIYLHFTKTIIPEVAYRFVPGLRNLDIDGTVIALTIGATIAAAFVAILPTLWHTGRARVVEDVNDALKEGGRSATAGPSRSRMRNVIAIGQVSMALILLVGAGLMVGTFKRFLKVQPGFDISNTLTMHIALPETKYRVSSDVRSFFARSLDGIRKLNGVRYAAVSASLPAGKSVYIQGRPEPRPDDPRPALNAVTADYLEAKGLPLLSGRGITRQDSVSSEPTVVISQVVAKNFWPSSDPIGQKIRFGASGEWLRVVGVCGDTKDWFTGIPFPGAYVSFERHPVSDATVLVRTLGDPGKIAAPATAAIHSVDSAQPVFDVKTMEQQMTEATSGILSAALSMTVYACVALALALLGIYSVVSYSVAQRTHEIGVRMALGAGKAQVLRLTLSQGVRITGFGLAFGIPVAIALTQFMSSMLYGVISLDRWIFVLFSALLASAGVIAAYVPARRACRVDAVTALRSE